MKKIKIKFFVIGFLSSVLTISLLVFGFIKYLENERIEQFEVENKKEVSNLQYSIIDLKKSDIEQLILVNPKDSKEYSLNDKKIVFLNFWATWCLPCITEMPSIQELLKRKENYNFVNFILASEDSKEKILAFEEKKQFDFNYATVKKESLPKFISHNIIPTTYIIDKENLLCYKFEGSINYNSSLFKKFLLTLK